MKKVLLFFLKPLSFLPAILIMLLIFQFSAQTGIESGELSHKVSVAIVRIGDELLDKNLEEWRVQELADSIEYYVRKGAHMSIYFVLAIAVSFPLYVYGLRGFPLLLVAGIICVGFACTDEYHQSFVAGRGPSVTDVCIDSVGVFLGIMLVRIVCWTFLAPIRAMERRKKRQQRIEARKQRQMQALPKKKRTATGSHLGRQRLTKEEILRREGKRHIY